MDWTNNKNFVGERVVTSMVAPGKKRSGMGTSAKKNRSVAVEATEEEEEEDQGGDDNIPESWHVQVNFEQQK